jgi:hypothetical protein
LPAKKMDCANSEKEPKMKKHCSRLVRWAGLALLIASMLVPQAGSLQAEAVAEQPPAGPEKPGSRVVPGELITEAVYLGDVTEGMLDEAPPIDETDYPKLESQLEQLYESAVLGKGRPLETFAGQRHIDLAAGTARVILEMEIDPEAHQAGPAAVKSVMLESGETATIEHAPPIAVRADLATGIAATDATYETAYQSWVQVLAPFHSLVALSKIDGVRYVRLPFPAKQLELATRPSEVGTLTSEGVALTNIDTWHTTGYDGAGINLAVYDFGFTGWATRQANGDLPSSPNLVQKDYSSVYSFSPDTSGYRHGTACAEIAYDMAPGSTVYLYAWGTEAEFGNAVADYQGVNGNKVATMSIGWVNAGPYDGTGPINDIVNTAANTYSIFWANSAGNDQKSHDSFTSAQYGSGDYVSFGGAQYNVFGPSSGYYWDILAGYTIDLFLEWDDWNAARSQNVNEQDYDLYLYRSVNSGTTWSQVAYSSIRQCNTNNPPVEAISYTPTVAGWYRLAIQRYETAGCAHTWGEWLDLYSWVNTGASNLWYHYNYCNSLTIPADADGAVATGAIFWGEDGTSPSYGLEPFSSLGPRNAYGGAQPATTWEKVDVVAPDGVSTATYGASDGTKYAGGGSGFWGTSAASPHAAGLAASIWEWLSTATLAQLRSYVELQAVDRPLGSCGGTAGQDNTYGEGRINGPIAPTSVQLSRFEASVRDGSVVIEFQRPDAWMLGPLAAAQALSLLILAAAILILVYRHRRRPVTEAAPVDTTGEA